MISIHTKKVWDDRIAYVLEYGDQFLSEWEREFVDSLEIRRSKGTDLTQKQSRKLTEIFRRIEEEIG